MADKFSGVCTGGQRECPPDFRPGNSHANVPPLFDTLMPCNDAIADFTSQSLGLPGILAYACKTNNSIAIKLVPECTKTCHFDLKNLKYFLGKVARRGA